MEQILRQAACEASQILMAGLPTEEQCVYQLSPAFEKKMARIIRHNKHPLAYRFVTRAASILLALLLSGTVWLSVDAEAREKFTSWVRQIRDTHFTYSFSDENVESYEVHNYRPTLLPEDWEEIDSWTDEGGSVVVYMDSVGQVSYFNATQSSKSTFSVGEVKKPVAVQMKIGKAEFFEGVTQNDSSVLVWSKNNILFSLTAQLECSELVRIAESVKIVK